MDAQNHYKKLFTLSKTTATYASISSLLSWDLETYMPRGAIEFRSEQAELMASLLHKQSTSSRFATALAKLISLESGEILDDKLTAAQLAALRCWRHDLLRDKKLTNTFVKKFASITSSAQHAWGEAKRQNAFKLFAPHLEKIVDLCRKKADLLGFKEHPYDALLNLYEPHMTLARLTPLFSKLKMALTTLLKNIGAHPRPADDFLKGLFPAHEQERFAQLLLKTMGFDQKTSRLDFSMHPFCVGIHPSDIRMTSHIHLQEPMANIFAVLHEGGHGLYHHKLPEEHFGSPLCEPASMAIDESQSRWWETLVGHSVSFWQHFYPLLQSQFSDQLQTISFDDFYRAINTAQPSLIRIHSDEVSYSLHIIIRFEIEKALLEGTLKVKEIPSAWNEKMREYLGISPTSDATGCLQDIHWSMGALGYFPSYTLGNLYAAQFFAVFEKTHADWKEKAAQGDFSTMRHWLHENIHKHGREFSPEELIVRVTGQSLSEQAYVHYLETKFKSLYHL